MAVKCYCTFAHPVGGNCIAVNGCADPRELKCRGCKLRGQLPRCSKGLQEWEGGQGEDSLFQLKGFCSFSCS